MANRQCDRCGTSFDSSQARKLRGQVVCPGCAQQALHAAQKKVVLTTTNGIEGYRIRRYLGIESVEIVIGTGVVSEFTSAITDFFGERSSAFEKKLAAAKQAALQRMKTLAFQKGANAVVGVDIDYTEFAANRIGVVVNGTLVLIEALPETQEKHKKSRPF
jgi:uncharacterized protein YbjQ (UPF0145 family)